MRSPTLATQVTLQNDILKMVFVELCSGRASALEPLLCRLPSLATGSGTATDGSAVRVEACNILVVLPQGISIADVSVAHPLSLNALGQEQQREQQRPPRTSRSGAYSNEESYGHLGLMPTSFDAVLLP
jgi:hypothetical protein